MRSKYDAVIVGGGHNGLVSAFYLARAGLDVAVVEARERVGGPCGTVEWLPGYRSSITNSPGSLEPQIVDDMELRSFGLDFVKVDPTLVMPFPDRTPFVGWRDRNRVAEEVRTEFSAHDAAAYGAFWEHAQDFGEALGVDLFREPPTYHEVMGRLSDPAREEAFVRFFMGSVKELMDLWFESDEIKALVAMLGVMGNRVGPSTPGSAYLLLQRPISMASRRAQSADDPRQQPLRGSTGLPRGGMGSIVDAMVRAVEAAGASIHVGCAVEEIRVERGRVAGVGLADGSEIDAPLVLSSVEPRTTLLGLVGDEHLPEQLPARLRARDLRGSASKLVLALDGVPTYRGLEAEDPRVYGACQFRISPSMDYMDQAYGDALRGRPASGPMYWGLIPSVTSPELAPEGRELMSLNLWHAPHRLAEGTWEEEKDGFAKRAIAELSTYFTDLEARVLDYRMYTPVELEREFGLPEANVTHGDMMPAMMMGHRPLPELAEYATPVAGLYLAGAGSWPGGLVTGLPGHNASARVLRDRSAAGGPLE